MGSWLLDQPNMGSEKSTKGLLSSSSSSSNSSSSTTTTKKSKNKMSGSNSSNSSLDNNNKQIRKPQRGLGVAQLEKIRLHTQLATSGFSFRPPYQPFFNPSFQATLQSASTAFGYSSTLGSSSSYGYHPNYMMMEIKDTMERSTNIGYGKSQPCPTTRWNPNIEVITHQPSMVTRHFLGNLERKYSRNDLFECTSSSRQNSKPNDNNKDLDLELKL